MQNKPWKNNSLFETYEEANKKRNKLLSIWSDNKEHEGMQVKIKRSRSKNKFVVKTRLHPDFVTKKSNKNETKKSRKTRKQNNKN